MHARRRQATLIVTALAIFGSVLGAHPADAAIRGRFVFVPSSSPGVIRVANAAGTNTVDTANEGFSHPQWGPDGVVIASSSTGTRILKPRAGAHGKLLPASVGSDKFPSMSPDGKRVVFSDAANDIVIQRVNSSTRTTLVPGAGVANAIARFSANSKFVFYTDNTGQLQRISINGGTPVQMTNDFDECTCRQPDASADGKLILFKRGTQDLVVKPATPPQNPTLTRVSTTGDAPVFSADHRFIAFLSSGGGGPILVARSNGLQPATPTALDSGGAFDWTS